MKKIALAFSVLAAILGISAYAVLQMLPGLRSRFAYEDRGPVLVQQIRSLSRLETVSYTEQKLLEGRKEWTGLPGWLMGDKLLFLAHGEVVAGVDLAGFGDRRLRLDGDRAFVKLPPPEIFHVRLDNKNSVVCSHETGWLSRRDPQLETQVRQRAEKALLESARKDKILDRARRNAEREIARLIKACGVKEVVFV